MEQLKRLRTERDLSQTKLAQLADLNPATVNQIEKGAREASTATLRKLAEALDVSLAKLLEDESPKVQAPLPFEEGQRRFPFVEAWASYMRQRADAWLRDLEEEGAEIFGEPRYVFEALDRNEQVQTEATMLLSAVFRATLGVALPDATTKDQAEIAAELGGPEEHPRRELTQGILEVMRASKEWSERTDGAWAGAVDKVEADKLARARERAEEAVRKRENVVAMFPLRDIVFEPGGAMEASA